MPEFLQHSFMVRALISALLLAPMCGLLGVFVVARKMSFFSDTISHAALMGVALGLLFDVSDPTLALLLVTLAVAFAILWLRENTHLLTDTIMALLLSGTVALAILIFTALKSFRGDVHRYLFGDILALSNTDMILSAILFVVITVWTMRFLSPITLMSLNEELAHACGVDVKKLNYLFIIALTLTVALSIRLLGIILVPALLVIPAASARNFAKNLRQQIIVSMAAGAIGGAIGTVASYYLDSPSGPCVVLSCITIFVISLIWMKLFKHQL